MAARKSLAFGPVGLTANLGRNVTLQAMAVGRAAPLSYQWLALNGNNRSRRNQCASLVISNIQFANAGSYQLFVSNSIATATSLTAPVKVINNKHDFILEPDFRPSIKQRVPKGYSHSLWRRSPWQRPDPLSMVFVARANRNYIAIPGATSDMLALDPALAVRNPATTTSPSAISLAASPSATCPVLPSALVGLKVQFARAWGYQSRQQSAGQRDQCHCRGHGRL